MQKNSSDKTKYNKHTIILAEDVYQYILENANNNKKGISEFVNDVFECMMKNNIEIKSELVMHLEEGSYKFNSDLKISKKQ